MTPPERKRLVKLVRDGIGEFVPAGTEVFYEKVEAADHTRLLRRKLLEEALEYLENPSLGELADVLQVVEDLAYVDLGATFDDVLTEAAAKKDERGGFDGGTAMYVVSTAPPRHEGEHG